MPIASDSAAILPAALLLGVDGGPANGTLGSWTLDGTGTDTPWLSAASLPERRVRAGPGLGVAFADGQPIGTWVAVVAPAADTAGARTTGVGGRETAGQALAQVRLDSLDRGRWVLAVRLDRADGRGDATFYWLLDVS